jgi:N-acetylated-alpha-linked acidic dipeptidase
VILILLHQRGGLFPGAAIHLPHSGLGFEELQKILLSTPKEHLTRQWSSYYTSGPHLAGKNISQALWTQKKWQEFGVKDTSLVSYDVYLNYPVSHRLALLEKRREGKAIAAHDQHAEGGQWEVKYEASLEEDVLEEDRTSGLPDRIPTFHGYSASGNVTASYVFANYGSYHDFEDLRRANVSLEGKVALVRYGHVYRGLKVKRAQELGMVAVIIYSDPGDDYNITIENGFKAYPYGPARQPSSVQRGSVQFLST